MTRSPPTTTPPISAIPLRATPAPWVTISRHNFLSAIAERKLCREMVTQGAGVARRGIADIGGVVVGGDRVIARGHVIVAALIQSGGAGALGAGAEEQTNSRGGDGH